MNVPVKEWFDAAVRLLNVLPRWLQDVVIIAALVGVGVKYLGRDVMELAERRIPAVELPWIDADRRHVGEDCELRTELLRGAKACHYADDAVVVRRADGSRAWSLPVSRASAPVVPAAAYGASVVSGAGLLGGGNAPACAAYESCVQPLTAHPRFDQAEFLYEQRYDQCWVDRWFRLPDGCELRVRVHECFPVTWYWNTAEWTCCREEHW